MIAGPTRLRPVTLRPDATEPIAGGGAVPRPKVPGVPVAPGAPVAAPPGQATPGTGGFTPAPPQAPQPLATATPPATASLIAPPATPATGGMTPFRPTSSTLRIAEEAPRSGLLSSLSPRAPLTTPTTLRPPLTPTNIPPITTTAADRPETDTVPSNLRGETYAPGSDPRLTRAQGQTDAAGNAVQNGQSFSDMTRSGEDRYRSLFGSGQVAGERVNPDVAFERQSTDVSAPGVNPNVDFRGTDTDARYRAVGTNAGPRNVNTQVAGGPAINTDFGTGNVQGGPAVAAQESDRTSRYGTAQDQALEGLGGPNRTDLAMKTLSDFEAAGARERDQRFRKVGQTASKFGNMGLGNVNAELGSIEGDYQRDLMSKRNELASSVAEGDVNDRYRTVDATAGLRGQEAGIDTGLRGEARTERGYGTDLDIGNEGRAFDRSLATDTASRQEREYGTGLGERNVGRDLADREYGTGLEERNIGRAQGERDTESLIERENIGRRASERDTALGLTERNVGRQMGERDTQLGVSERNVGRRTGERDAALAAGERQVGRRMDERDAMTGLSERNQDRGFERSRAGVDAAARNASADLSDRYNRAEQAGSLEDRVFNQGAANRDEFRGERGRQDELAQRTLENRIKQREMENAEQEDAFRRSYLQQQAGTR